MGFTENSIWAIFLVILYCAFTSISIVITGDRGLISGSLNLPGFIKMIFDWRFILAMALAVGSRFTFVLINSTLLKIPSMAQNSTTITTFITALSYIFIIITNFFVLGEKLTWGQFAGSGLILAGILLIVK